MWWILFAAVDVYIGLVVLDLLARSAPPEKVPRIIAKKIMMATLVVLAIAFVAKFWFKPLSETGYAVEAQGGGDKSLCPC